MESYDQQIIDLLKEIRDLLTPVDVFYMPTYAERDELRKQCEKAFLQQYQHEYIWQDDE